MTLHIRQELHTCQEGRFLHTYHFAPCYEDSPGSIQDYKNCVLQLGIVSTFYPSFVGLSSVSLTSSKTALSVSLHINLELWWLGLDLPHLLHTVSYLDLPGLLSLCLVVSMLLFSHIPTYLEPLGTSISLPYKPSIGKDTYRYPSLEYFCFLQQQVSILTSATVYIQANTLKHSWWRTIRRRRHLSKWQVWLIWNLPWTKLKISQLDKMKRMW